MSKTDNGCQGNVAFVNAYKSRHEKMKALEDEYEVRSCIAILTALCITHIVKKEKIGDISMKIEKLNQEMIKTKNRIKANSNIINAKQRMQIEQIQKVLDTARSLLSD